MRTRRAILIGAAGLPFLRMGAHAATGRNSRLLLCRLSLDKTHVRRDGTIRVGASLEAREQYVRVFAPLRWGEVRGFRLELRPPGGKFSQPNFHIPVGLLPPDLFRSAANYRALDVGEQAGFSTEVKAKDLFPTPGRFRLRAVYVPEPPRTSAPMQAIVFEDGEVESDEQWVIVA